jgi:hypothetical protein
VEQVVQEQVAHLMAEMLLLTQLGQIVLEVEQVLLEELQEVMDLQVVFLVEAEVVDFNLIILKEQVVQVVQVKYHLLILVLL